MYISIVKRTIDKQDEAMFSIQINESGGVYKFSEGDGASFVIDEAKYDLSGEFIADSLKGFALLKKDGVSLFRALTAIDPTFLLTLNIGNSTWLELNISVDS